MTKATKRVSSGVEPKELGILFKAEMVRAILAGKKTQTRRLVKFPKCPCGCNKVAEYDGADPDGNILASSVDQSTGHTRIRCPFGPAGRRLWVRETWAVPPGSDVRTDVAYRADLPAADEAEERVRRIAGRARGPWHPSLLMPRWASRIDLDVTAVRVERLHDISDEDARAEGCDDGPGRGGHLYPSPRAARAPLGHRGVFRELWDEINGKRAPWASNPCLWVISFRRVSP